MTSVSARRVRGIGLRTAPLILTQSLGIKANAFVSGKTPLPATTTVDYVCVWK